MSDTISIKMRDLVPHKHAVRCTIGDSNHVQEIEVVSVRWLDDGSKLSAMLDSHNFLVEEPDTVLGCIVEMNPQDSYYRKRVDEWVLPPRPTPAPTVESLLAEVERLTKERDHFKAGLRERAVDALAAREEIERLRFELEQAQTGVLNANEQVSELKAALRDVAERQREACADAINDPYYSHIKREAAIERIIRATPLVTEEEP